MQLLAQEFVLVVSKVCITTQVEALQNIYLKKEKSIGSCQAIPLNIQADMPQRMFFMKEVIHVSPTQWNRYWDMMHFKGVQPPHVVHSNQAMAAYIQKVSGALGYLPRTFLEPSMQVLATFEMPKVSP